MSALKAAAVRMGGLREGRKSIIFVSEGFTSALPPQLQDPNAAIPGLGNPNRRNPQAQTDDRYDMATMTGHAQRHARGVRHGQPAEHVDLRGRSARARASSNTTSTRALACSQDATSLKSSIDSLHVLANNTDGRAIVNRNDLAAA